MKGFRYMKYINGILKKYELNIDELLILVVSFTVFLPFYFLVFSFNALFFYLLVSGKIIPVFKETPFVKNILAFTALIFSVSVIKQNLYGIGVSIIIFEFFVFFMYYRTIINRKLFSKIINLYMIVSIFCFILTILAVLYKKFSMNLKFYEFIEYMSLLVLSLTKNSKKVFAFLGVFTIVIVVLMFFSNKIFPRYEFIGNSLGTRKEIWKNAIELFKQTYLFGSGPMAYQNASWVTHPANHAHNILLDVLINFGIIGNLVIAPLFIGLCKQVYDIRKRNLFRLIIALTVVVILHGMLDVTILWHQTAYIYFSVLLAVGKVSTFESKFIF